MATVYAVDVNVNLLNGGSGGFGGGALNVNGLAQLNTQFQSLQTNITRTQSASQGLLGVWSQLFVARELTRFGAAGISAFGGLIQGAADFQTSLGNIQMATGATRAAMDELGQSIIKVSQTHVMTMADTAEMVAIASKGGIKDPQQLLALLDPKQAGSNQAGIADFADVMLVAQKMQVSESAKLGMEFATLLGGQGPKPVLTALNQFYKASQFSPEGPQALFETFKKLHATGSKLGATTEQELQVSALLGQVGLEGAGGRETASALLRIATGQGVKRGQTGESHALNKMLDSQRNEAGGIDLIKMVHALGQFEQQHPKTALTTEREAFSMVGLRALGILADPKHIAQLDAMVAQWDRIPGLQQAHGDLTEQINSQLKEFSTDLHDTGVILGTGLLPSVTMALKAFNTTLVAANDALQHSPNFKSAASQGLGVLGLGAAGLTAGGAAMGLAAFAKMAAGAAGAGTAAEATLTGVAGTAAGFSAAILGAVTFVVPVVLAALALDKYLVYLGENTPLGRSITGRSGAPHFQTVTTNGQDEIDREKAIHFHGDNHFHGVQDVETLGKAVKEIAKGHSRGTRQGGNTHSGLWE